MSNIDAYSPHHFVEEEAERKFDFHRQKELQKKTSLPSKDYFPDKASWPDMKAFFKESQNFKQESPTTSPERNKKTLRQVNSKTSK